MTQREKPSAVSNQRSGMNVDLHIEELVLEGLARRDRHRIALVVECELTRLFTEGGVPSSWATGGEIARLDVGAFDAKQAPNQTRSVLRSPNKYIKA